MRETVVMLTPARFATSYIVGFFNAGIQRLQWKTKWKHFQFSMPSGSASIVEYHNTVIDSSSKEFGEYRIGYLQKLSYLIINFGRYCSASPNEQTGFPHCLPNLQSSALTSRYDDTHALTYWTDSSPPASNFDLHPATCKIAVIPRHTYRRCTGLLWVVQPPTGTEVHRGAINWKYVQVLISIICR